MQRAVAVSVLVPLAFSLSLLRLGGTTLLEVAGFAGWSGSILRPTLHLHRQARGVKDPRFLAGYGRGVKFLGTPQAMEPTPWF